MSDDHRTPDEIVKAVFGEPDRFVLNFEDLAMWFGGESDEAQIARSNQWKVHSYREWSKLLGLQITKTDEEIIRELGGSGPYSPGLNGIFNNGACTMDILASDLLDHFSVYRKALAANLKDLSAPGYMIETDDALYVMPSSSFELPKMEVKFPSLMSTYGGFDVRSRTLERIVTMVPAPSWLERMMLDGWKKLRPKYTGPIVVECETPMYIGRHPFVRVTATAEHPTVGAWRWDDDNGTAVKVKELRVDATDVFWASRGGVQQMSTATLRPIVDNTAFNWVRADGGRIAEARVSSGRYIDRLPTNRKRKRERCKARRRERFTERRSTTRMTSVRSVIREHIEHGGSVLV